MSGVNLPIAKPKWRDVLNNLKKEIALTLNCHAIGTVYSFNPANQTVVATINYKKVLNKKDPVSGLYNEVLEDYPILLDMPAVVLGGGGGYLSFPIKKGDECLILFNDRDLDNWFQGVAPTEPRTGRLHSFADGIALVGLRSSTKAISGYPTDKATLNYGASTVGVGDKVLITNGTTLNTLLAALIDAITGLKIDVPAIGPGPQGTVDATSQQALAQAKSGLAGLLE